MNEFILLRMINLTYDQIVDRIVKNSSASKEDIEAKVKVKMEKLSGLVSKEGAAHIVANELGVKVLESPGKLQINDIIAGMRSVEVIGRVHQAYEVREFKKEDREGKVGNFVLADRTGMIRVVLWNSQADNLAKLSPGTPVKIKGGYSKDNQGRKEIHLNDRSELIINPPEEVPEINIQVTRKKISDLQEYDNNVELFGTIVQVFEPRYYEVDENGKRVKPEEYGGTMNYAYVTNFQLDDGTEIIRCVCFKQQTEKLFEKTTEEMLSMRMNNEALSELRNLCIGKQVKVLGRASKNQMFDRIEFISNSLDMNPSPDDELKKLQEEKSFVEESVE